MKNGINTRTLAELYLKQGHTGKALEIVKNLLSDRPNDESLLELERKILDTRSGEALVEGVEESPGGEIGSADPVDRRVFFENEQQALREEPPRKRSSVRERATDIGVAAVEQLATHAVDRLNGLLDRIRERSRN